VTGLNVISGAPDALRDALAARVAALRSSNPLSPIHVLVGASLQRPYLARWLAANLGGHANVRIDLPGDLGLVLGAPALVAAGRRALPPLADRVLLAQISRAHPGYFAPVAQTAGFGEALYRLVRELRGAGRDLSNLAPLLEGVTDARDKSGALAEILAAFEERRKDFYGADDALAAADPDRLEGLGLLVYGVLDMPPALERVIVGIASRLPVDVFLPDVAGADEAPVNATREHLIALGADVAAIPEPAPDGPVLSRIRTALFTPPAEPLAPDGTLQLVSAPDPSREVRAAARACLAWAEEGVPFWDMALAYRQGDDYRPLIEAVFAEANIPVYMHEGSPVAERPLGRQALGLLALFESELSRRSVMDFLTDARLPNALHEEFDGIPATRWDSISREAGIVASAEQWAQRLRGRVEELRGEDEDKEPPEWIKQRIADAEQLAHFMADLYARLLARPARAPWAVHLDYLQALLARYVAGSQVIVEALRGLERFTALESEVTFEQFLDVVRRGVETLRSEDVLGARGGAFARRGVNVVAVNSLAGIEFARVWILGATERSFPPPARQDPILLDDERAAFSEGAGVELAPRARRGREEEFMFALACEAARERLVVSYARRATGESRPRLPSVFFRELASQLAGRRVSAEDAPLLNRLDVERIPGDAIGAPVPGGRHASDPDRIDAAAAGAISSPERDRTFLQVRATQPLAVATFERAEPAFASALVAARARRSRTYSEWDGALSPAAREAIAALMRPDRVFSPTSLENFGRCPQRFLMGDLLRIRKVEEPERTVRMDSLRRGSLVHRIFQRFYEEAGGAGCAALAPDADRRMRKIATEECDRARERGETGYPAMWEADRLEILEDCLAWLEIERNDPRSAGMPLAACEVRFGPARPGEDSSALARDVPVELQLEGRTLRYAGRIDRVTWDADPPSQFRVVDYKTGKLYSEKSAQLQGGRMLQLPLYVYAAAELLGVGPGAGEAAYVYPTRKGGFDEVRWSREDLTAREDELNALLVAMLEAMDRGDFMIAPWHTDACRICDLDPVCPLPRGKYVERRENDERIERFNEEIRSVE
jgi:ATP-dependent helicase/nuclease subunit B